MPATVTYVVGAHRTTGSDGNGEFQGVRRLHGREVRLCVRGERRRSRPGPTRSIPQEGHHRQTKEDKRKYHGQGERPDGQTFNKVRVALEPDTYRFNVEFPRY